MDFKEFVNKLEQDLKDAMADISPGATVDVRSVEKLQDGSYTGITISPAGGNVGMNLNANQLFDQMQDLGCNQSSGRIWQRQSGR